MTSYRRSTSLPHLVCAGESGGAYDAGDRGHDPDDPGPAAGSPLGRLAERLDVLERAKRDVLDTYCDVTAWAGTAKTTGYTQSEWLALVGRVPGREQWKYDLLVSRLPGLPVTAVTTRMSTVMWSCWSNRPAPRPSRTGVTVTGWSATASGSSPTSDVERSERAGRP